MFINFHASPRRRGARPRFEWWQYRPVPGSNSLIINSLSQNTIESRTTGSSFTPFRAGTCFSAASTLSLSSSLLSSGAAVVRARVPTLWFPAEKKKKEKMEEEENVEEQKEEQDPATLRTKTRPWIRVGISFPPRILPPWNRACSARLPLVWTEIKVTGASSPGFNVGRIEDRKWLLSWTISWERYFPRRILLLLIAATSHVMERAYPIGANTVVIKIRAILLLLAFRCSDKGFADQV